MAVCGSCRKEKSEDEFYFRNRSKGTRQSCCIPCHKVKINQHYQDNKTYYKDKAKRRKQTQRNESILHLIEYFETHPCIDCGDDDPVVLDFDHVRGQKEFNVSDRLVKGYSWGSVLDEVAKCEVRCASCHRRETARRGHTWRYAIMHP